MNSEGFNEETGSPFISIQVWGRPEFEKLV